MIQCHFTGKDSTYSMPDPDFLAELCPGNTIAPQSAIPKMIAASNKMVSIIKNK